ncbi:MAG TPA: BatD family protein [Chitinophagaceae bacterium]
MKKPVFIFVAVIVTLVLRAQVVFTTLVPKESIVEGESFRVQYVIEGAEKVINFKSPSFSPFRLVSGPEIYPGQIVESSKVIPTRNTIYTLQARQPGMYKIPGAAATVNGELIKSNAAWVTVISRAEANRRRIQNGELQDNLSYLRPGEDPYEKIKQNLFVKVAVNKKICFAGEPIVATFKLYSRLQSRSEIYKNPGLYGFTVQEMIGVNDKRMDEEMLSGKLFDVHTIRKVQLYPLQAGSFSIDPMEIKNKVEFSRSTVNQKTEQEVVEGVFEDKVQATDPGKEIVETIIRSEPVSIIVKPLPVKNKPDDFTGATGRFTIHAFIEKNELARNEEGYLNISITGKGNFSQLSAPVIAWPVGMEGFEPLVNDSLDKSTTPLTGSKKFRYAFVAAHAGKYELPAISFSFYDPDSNRYKTIRSNPVTVNVSTVGKAQPARTANKTSITDINHKASMVAACIIVFLLLGVMIYWITKKKDKQVTEPPGKWIMPDITIDEILKPAYLLIPAADKDFYAVLYQSVWKYLGSHFYLQGSEMNKYTLVKKMLDAGKSPELINNLHQVLEHCEAGMFTNATLEENKEALLAKVKKLLEEVKAN